MTKFVVAIACLLTQGINNLCYTAKKISLVVSLSCEIFPIRLNNVYEIASRIVVKLCAVAKCINGLCKFSKAISLVAGKIAICIAQGGTLTECIIFVLSGPSVTSLDSLNTSQKVIRQRP